MSSGDDIVAGRITTAEETTHLVGALPNPPDVQFGGNVIFEVIPQQGKLAPHQTLDGIHGYGTNGSIAAGSLGSTSVADLAARTRAPVSLAKAAPLIKVRD